MKKISNFSIVGMLGGFIFSLFSGWRYFVIFPDEDRAIVYVLIGIMIMAIAWLYNKNMQNQNTLEAIETYLADKER